MLLLAVVSGVALPPLLAVTFVTVDAVAPAGTAAEAFAWVSTAFTTGAALGAAVDGVILDQAILDGAILHGAILHGAGGVAIGFVLAPVTIALGALLYRRLSASLRER
jgi:hypothetical protein